MRFKLKDHAQWNEDAVRNAFKVQDFPELTVTTMPPGSTVGRAFNGERDQDRAADRLGKI